MLPPHYAFHIRCSALLVRFPPLRPHSLFSPLQAILRGFISTSARQVRWHSLCFREFRAPSQAPGTPLRISPPRYAAIRRLPLSARLYLFGYCPAFAHAFRFRAMIFAGRALIYFDNLLSISIRAEFAPTFAAGIRLLSFSLHSPGPFAFGFGGLYDSLPPGGRVAGHFIQAFAPGRLHARCAWQFSL